MSNPLYQTNDSPNGSTQPTKAVNRQGVFVKRTHNTFDMSYFNFKTQRYGVYEPFFVMEGVPGDKIPLSSSHTVRSFALTSPFLSKLTLNKDYFMVPMQAILPNTWELIYKNPSQGDDVPNDCNTLIDYSKLVNNLVVNLSSSGVISKTTGAYAGVEFSSALAILSPLFFLETLCSRGSLLSSLGFCSPRIFRWQGSTESFYQSAKDYTIDEIIDIFVSKISLLSFCLKIDDIVYKFTTDQNDFEKSATVKYLYHISPRAAFDILRDYIPYIYVTKSENGRPNYFDCNLAFNYNDADTELAFNLASSNPDIGLINISRILAYQMACYQFYVNPQVDFLYNSQLYRDNFFSLLKKANPTITFDSFTINGVNVNYDFFSQHYLKNIFEDISSSYGGSEQGLVLFSIWMYIFGYNRALRFGDYFTDSRTVPFAPGASDAPVVGESVSAVDMTKSIVLQRYLNAVVKLGNNFGDYLRGIFGETPSPDYHFPKFISHQEFDISGFEVANTTGSDQGNLVTNLRSSDDKYAFEVEISMPCILLGISYFVMPNVYCSTIDKHFFHRDRFDMFNPMLQYIGDQAIDTPELSSLLAGTGANFGYQSRNAEYKQRFSVIHGGFPQYLPAWAFVSDNPIGLDQNYLPITHQSPHFIRCNPFEFDRFMSTLSGSSLASSFHFIVVYNNKCVCNRPMEVNPNLL